MWYKNNYRRHLLDMHIEDWNDEFLSEFSPEDYYDNLKRAGITAPMIYFQSHVGYCYYPTKSGYMHKAFEGRENMMKRLVDLCHEGGMDVIGYYSPTYNNWAHDTHPSWRMLNQEGKSERELGNVRYGYCCPNNDEFRSFVKEQIHEMTEYFTFEGMFYDMPFWPHHCYCESCKNRWEKECGGELPTSKEDARWQLFEDKREEWIGDFAQFLTDETRKLLPNISVEQNYAYAALEKIDDISIGEKVNEACDYVGGDLHGDFLTQSFCCKFYYAVTHNQPFEYMTARCEPNLQTHTMTRTRDKLMLGVLLTYAHHGANLLIDAIDPVGTMNPKVYDLFGEINHQAKAYEPYLTGTMIQDVGIYYCMTGKTNLQGQDFNNYTGARNCVRTMTRNHIPAGIIATENKDKISNYSFVILSNPNHLSVDARAALIEYVSQGGVLYFSNTDEEELFDELIGGKCQGYTESNKTYVGALEEYVDLLEGFDEKYPLPFSAKLPIVQGIESEYIVSKMVLPYTVPEEKAFASIHSNPPGVKTDIPALVVKPYGKGKVIWSAAPIENEETFAYQNIMVNLIKRYSGSYFSFSSNAPQDVELIRFDDEEKQFIQINAVALNDGDIAVVHSPFKVFVKTSKTVKRIRCIGTMEEIAFEVVDGGICFLTKPLHIFDMYQIEV